MLGGDALEYRRVVRCVAPRIGAEIHGVAGAGAEADLGSAAGGNSRILVFGLGIPHEHLSGGVHVFRIVVAALCRAGSAQLLGIGGQGVYVAGAVAVL